MTMTLLEILKDLRDNPSRRKEWCGICSNVRQHPGNEKDEASLYISWLTRKWPDAGEDWQYPVGGVKEYSLERAKDTIWQNPRRLALLDWMIAELEKGAQDDSAIQ